ncbi:preprotein translocase subunit SecE [bacterium]|nr:preprotein translocase subunit SecE [candidate division CSSED10-310 bacterium]
MFKKLITFLKEVRIELKKVTWPKRSEVMASTWVVIVTTIILGMFLGVVDLSLSKGIQPTLEGAPTVFSWVSLVLFGGVLAWIYKIIQS